MDQERDLGPIREPIVDGIFYPAEREQLRREIRRLLSESTTPPGDADGIVAPHASLAYCGSCLASAYRSVSGRPVRRVLILGPVYRDPEPALIVPESGGFSTPLGTIPVIDMLKTMNASDRLPLLKRDIPHLEEHCLEIQLPFIQYLFPEAGIIPVLVGDEGPVCYQAVQALIAELRREATEDLLTVVSVNLTSTVDVRRARQEAGRVVDALLSQDETELLAGAEDGSLSARGLVLLAAVTESRRESHRVELLCRESSATQLDDPTSTVEYGSFAFFPRSSF
jgi:MEMO1 family protein